MATMKLQQHKTRIEDLGMFTCKPTASTPQQFLIRGVVVDRLASVVRSPVAAKPAAALLLPMPPETAIQLAVAILRAAEQANIPLPKEVSLQSGTI